MKPFKLTKIGKELISKENIFYLHIEKLNPLHNPVEYQIPNSSHCLDSPNLYKDVATSIG